MAVAAAAAAESAAEPATGEKGGALVGEGGGAGGAGAGGAGSASPRGGGDTFGEDEVMMWEMAHAVEDIDAAKKEDEDETVRAVYA